MAKKDDPARLLWEANKKAKGVDPQEYRRKSRQKRDQLRREGMSSSLGNPSFAEACRVSADRTSHYKEQELFNDECCHICGSKETKIGRGGRVQPLSRDHCHTTGKWRGVLCHLCNAGIGYFCENLTNLEKAAEYLRRWGRSETDDVVVGTRDYSWRNTPLEERSLD